MALYGRYAAIMAALRADAGGADWGFGGDPEEPDDGRGATDFHAAARLPDGGLIYVMDALAGDDENPDDATGDIEIAAYGTNYGPDNPDGGPHPAAGPPVMLTPGPDEPGGI